MIVEDDPMLVEIYQKKLEDSGFDVKPVANGSFFRDVALAWKPDLILLDVVLPDVDGYEILELARKDSNLKDIPIYVLSNLSAKEDIERAAGLGARGFLTKSNYTPTQLAEEVKKILQNPNQQKKKQAEARSDGPVEPEPEKKDRNGKKVLIIEDEDIFIQIFGDKLRQEGFEVVAAKNGKWGLKEAEKGEYSCILLDMMMPAMDGYSAARELRANENTKNIPIIILSNSAVESEVKKAMDLGVNAYFIKTQVTPGEIVDEINRLTRQNSSKLTQ